METPVEITESPQRIDVPDARRSWRRIIIRNDGPEPIPSPDVQAADQLDLNDLDAIVTHVCKPGMGEAEKAAALFGFLKDTVVKWALPNPDGSQNPMQILNVYGYCNCGGFSITLATLAAAAGLKTRNVHLPGHGVTEIQHDGAWHLYDSNLQATYPKSDGTLASVEEVQADLSLLERTEHDFHAPRTFNLDELKSIYGQCHALYLDPPAPEDLHQMNFALLPGETLAWSRDAWTRFYPYQNEVFMVEPPPHYCAGGTLRFDGGTLSADAPRKAYTLSWRRRLPWAILGGCVRLAGHRTSGDGQVSLVLKREDRELTVGGILTERRDCEGEFSVVFDFSRAAALPPPAPTLFELELELIIYKVRPESVLSLREIEIEIALQRAPQSLPPSDLKEVELFYRDDATRRRASVAIE